MVYFDFKGDEGTWVSVLVSQEHFVTEGVMGRGWIRNHDLLDLGFCIDVLYKVDCTRTDFPVLTEEGDLRDVRHERLRCCVVPHATNHGESVFEDRLDDVFIDGVGL